MKFIILCLVLGAGVPGYLSGSVLTHAKEGDVIWMFDPDNDNDINRDDEKTPVIDHPEEVNIEGLSEIIISDTLYVELGVIVGQMKYDKNRITVKAGKPVVIVFTNNDVMLHNILILEPGTLEQVGMAADKMVADPEAQEKGFIPDMDAILHASPLVNPGQSHRLVFTASEKKGEYPFVCTFPGHWRLMQGVMVVE